MPVIASAECRAGPSRSPLSPAVRASLHAALQVEQLPSLHGEVNRVGEQPESQCDGEALVLAAAAGQQARARLVDWLEDERPPDAIQRAGIAADDECPPGLDRLDNKAVIRRRRPREEVADLDALQLGNDPL